MDVCFAMADVPEACLPGELYGSRPTRQIALQSDFWGLLPRVWRDWREDENEREGEGKRQRENQRAWKSVILQQDSLHDRVTAGERASTYPWEEKRQKTENGHCCTERCSFSLYAWVMEIVEISKRLHLI